MIPSDHGRKPRAGSRRNLYRKYFSVFVLSSIIVQNQFPRSVVCVLLLPINAFKMPSFVPQAVPDNPVQRQKAYSCHQHIPYNRFLSRNLSYFISPFEPLMPFFVIRSVSGTASCCLSGFFFFHIEFTGLLIVNLNIFAKIIVFHMYHSKILPISIKKFCSPYICQYKKRVSAKADTSGIFLKIFTFALFRDKQQQFSTQNTLPCIFQYRNLRIILILNMRTGIFLCLRRNNR